MEKKLKGIQRQKKTLSNGEKVCYHYIRGNSGRVNFWKSTDGIAENSTAYNQLYQEALDNLKPSKGKFREVIIAYKNSPEYEKLAPRTKKDIDTSIYADDGIDKNFGNAPTAVFNDPRIRKYVCHWVEGIAARSTHTARHRMSHLARLNSWAVNKGLLDEHHLQKVRIKFS